MNKLLMIAIYLSTSSKDDDNNILQFSNTSYYKIRHLSVSSGSYNSVIFLEQTDKFS